MVHELSETTFLGLRETGKCICAHGLRCDQRRGWPARLVNGNKKFHRALSAHETALETSMLPWSVTEKMLRDVEEMRSFYASVGLSEVTIERAIEAKFGVPV